MYARGTNGERNVANGLRLGEQIRSWWEATANWANSAVKGVRGRLVAAAAAVAVAATPPSTAAVATSWVYQEGSTKLPRNYRRRALPPYESDHRAYPQMNVCLMLAGSIFVIVSRVIGRLITSKYFYVCCVGWMLWEINKFGVNITYVIGIARICRCIYFCSLYHFSLNYIFLALKNIFNLDKIRVNMC